jgi:hypothetical protein
VLVVSVIGALFATIFLLAGFVEHKFIVTPLDKKRRELFNLKAKEKPTPSAASHSWRDNDFANALALSFLFFAAPLPVFGLLFGLLSWGAADWPVVENTTTCVILLRSGDSYVAADYQNGMIRRTFTIYQADNLPTFGMRHFGSLPVAPQEPNSTAPKTTCPKPREK